MKWFKHETHASTDAKLVKLRMRYGLEGYGLYWYCLEAVARGVEPHNLTFELEHDAEIIAFETGLHAEIVEQMMRYMVEIGLFEDDRGVITCLKMAKRMDSSMTSNPKMREMLTNIRKKHGFVDEKLTNSHDRVMTQSCEGHDLVMQERKKERKKDILREPKRFVAPSIEDVRGYIEEKGYQIDANAFVNHYESVNWYRGKTKIKDWKACVRTWVKNSTEKAEPWAGAK